MGTSVSQREALTWLARVLCVVGSIALVLSSVLDQRGLLAAAGLLCLLLLISVLSLSRRDGEALLTAMVACVLLIPENLVLVGPLRSVGNPAELVGLVCLALWAAGRMLGVLGFQQGHPGRWALLVFCLAGAASFVAAQFRHLSFAETAATNRIGFLLVAAVGIAIMATDGLEDRRRFDSLISRVVLIAGVAAAIGIVEFLQESFHYADLKLPGLTSYSEVASELVAPSRGSPARRPTPSSTPSSSRRWLRWPCTWRSPPQGGGNGPGRPLRSWRSWRWYRCRSPGVASWPSRWASPSTSATCRPAPGSTSRSWDSSVSVSSAQPYRDCSAPCST